MDVRCREVQEERLVLVLGDPLDGPFGEQGARLFVVIDLVRLECSAESIGAFPGCRYGKGRRRRRRLSAEDQWIVRVVAEVSLVFHINKGAATVHQRHTKVMVESDILRPRPQRNLPIAPAFLETKMPFPQTRGRVAHFLEHLADRQGVRGND